MRGFPIRCLLAITALTVSPLLQAEEKNGVQLNVSKTTIDRADQRPGFTSSSTRIDRTEALKVSVRNASFRPMPEGEVHWEILVRKYSSTYTEILGGKEKLKALRAAEAEEMVIGGAQVQGWKDPGSTQKDKIEWQVIVMAEGKELVRSSSTPAFDTLAKRATRITPPTPTVPIAPTATPAKK